MLIEGVERQVGLPQKIYIKPKTISRGISQRMSLKHSEENYFSDKLFFPSIEEKRDRGIVKSLRSIN